MVEDEETAKRIIAKSVLELMRLFVDKEYEKIVAHYTHRATADEQNKWPWTTLRSW